MSERTRSSINLGHPISKEIVLHCKGAGDLILSRLAAGAAHQDETRRHLQGFKNDGLRAFCRGHCVLDPDFYAAWTDRFREANCAIVGRNEQVNQVANELECDLILFWTTAIEDHPQFEVADTIGSMLLARIHRFDSLRSGTVNSQLFHHTPDLSQNAGTQDG
jgi:magnesium-transporting ATPase (P-type)